MLLYQENVTCCCLHCCEIFTQCLLPASVYISQEQLAQRELASHPCFWLLVGTQPCGYEDTGIKVLDQAYCASSACFSFFWTPSALPRTFGRSFQGSVVAGGKCLLQVLSFVSASTTACSAVVLLSAECRSSAMNKQHQESSAPNACSCLSSKPPFYQGFINDVSPRHFSHF